MEDELRLFLLLIGTVFILAVLAHGIWKIRKTNQETKKTRVAPRVVEDDDTPYNDQEGFDDLGLGEVRVVSSNSTGTHVDTNETREQSDIPYSNARRTELDDYNETDATTRDAEDKSSQNIAERPVNRGDESQAVTEQHEATARQNAPAPVKEKLYGSVVTNPKPHMASGMSGMRMENGGSHDAVVPFPEPPGFLLKEGETPLDSSDSGNGNTLSEHNIVQTADSVPMRTEPFYQTDTLDDEAPVVSNALKPEIDDFSLDAPEPLSSGSPEKIESASAAGFQEQGKRLVKSKRSKTISRKPRQEPKFGDDQMRIDFDDSQTEPSVNQQTQQSGSTKPSTKDNSADALQEQEVLVLNVRAKDEAPIAGAALLPMLLTLGFKFGDQDIFHRHVNANGKGPVLFSLANMFKPGVFDIDSLENFTTQGVSLFMILPIEGDPHQVFNMMHNAARKLADEFDAQVLDGRRSVLTKQGLQQYVEKIREFERKRMIARS